MSPTSTHDRLSDNGHLRMPAPDDIFHSAGSITFFNQVAIKVETDGIDLDEYYEWLEYQKRTIEETFSGAQILEKEDARLTAPLNTAVYYDTNSHAILPTGSLLRTSCNKITHAFCAFKLAEAEGGVRADHRYVFEGAEKAAIQADPTSEEAVGIVMKLLRRRDIVHPGTYLEKYHGISAAETSPAISLADHRYTFYLTLSGHDVLRCSFDRYTVADLRKPLSSSALKTLSEVEIALYPRIKPEVAADPRVPEVIENLSHSLCEHFRVKTTKAIKYQRAAQALGLLG